MSMLKKHVRKAKNPDGFALWVRRRVDPDEALVILFAIICFWAGWSTWNDLVGKPTDAPHLRIPGELRALMWWACGGLGLFSLRLKRGCAVRKWILSPIGMGFMVSLRFASYAASWIVSWEWIDNFIPDSQLKGDPNAWGSMWVYLMGNILVLCIMFAPYDWTYLNRQTNRKGRLEKKLTGGGTHHDGTA